MPAPLDHEAITAAPFGTSPTRPGAACTGPDVYAWEPRHLFAGAWTRVGRAA
ncbi:hypothetical protein Drose_02800 [Dactylosporangium roseum]|uniref:Uncharacterized protein n=1 Tax=Dactylosporangium roseum TaxID=47989 RepID=A0ABY5ZIR0_9ACTN|nr:hypothetical protein [Dactylosporangium roseum]UWZ40845.1 hypothetical protein Drose_02800 [Dactylosporangium roseum]